MGRVLQALGDAGSRERRGRGELARGRRLTRRVGRVSCNARATPGPGDPGGCAGVTGQVFGGAPCIPTSWCQPYGGGGLVGFGAEDEAFWSGGGDVSKCCCERCWCQSEGTTSGRSRAIT
ncbi:uncharacterized protein BDZ99DRAFT_131982 [Mytilinidion resinicola]|uniref:Uncharacterized protein n=1 Tax=Mytilinidion resinicola TaxID=574789 RepID=A0A6A6Z6B2_9PEZI|nr:uncharacterized protein BDZ99DRAFT_131982 [Mytilinidion resinicola]KAF2816249.1 hypothetical protein BDZ99DRAFT_131982 [Mytilinidion resinicola]